MRATIYTETTVYAAPQQFVAEAPYQIVIADLEDGKRVTGRVEGDAVHIGDTVDVTDQRDGVPYFRKLA